MEGHQGSMWVNGLPAVQRQALNDFFKGTPDEALQRVKARQFPLGLLKSTLEGYVRNAVEPAIAQGQDRVSFRLGGQQVTGMQAFRRTLIEQALPFLR